ncbi:ABC transporter [Nibricoccus aquaticus]|uniref:ABC transporter n=2 Tax=Nibricoccus aquaticus TaxID=2576891 RepID=A0A290Q404_9BACT|nr:ABC transporter [Nibricoccus aquaticus]
MIYFEILRLAFSSLWTNKLRSSLTIFGMSIGVFSIIGVMTFIAGAKAQLDSGLSRLGANSFQIQRFPALMSNPWQRYGNRPEIKLPAAQRFKDLMGETAKVNLQIRRGGIIASYLDRRTTPNMRLVGTDDNFLSSSNFEIARGRNLGAEDVALGRSVCIIGDEVAKKLFPDVDPLGLVVRAGGQMYTVIGLVAPKGTSFGESQDDFIAIPITRWLAVMGGGMWRTISINVQAPSQELLPAVQDTAVGVMRQVRGLEPEDENNFEVFTNDSLIATFQNVTNMVAIGSFGVSAIALLAAGVGVMNIMLVSVTERTKEIGIRKSIGARKKNILFQFLIEAVVLALIGGFVGVVLGVVGGNAVSSLMNIDMIFPWGWAIAGMAVCGGIGVVFGLYPAWKAASLDPIEALRHE